MANVIVEEQSLIDIGEALRSKLGNKKIAGDSDSPVEIVSQPPMAKDYNPIEMIYHPSYLEPYYAGNNYYVLEENPFYEVVKIPGASKIEVQLWVNLFDAGVGTTECIQVVAGDARNNLPTDSAVKYEGKHLLGDINLTFENTDTITFFMTTNYDGDAFSGRNEFYFGYYAKIKAYDENGKEILYTENTFLPSEMAEAIESIEGGEIVIDAVLEEIEITSNGTYSPSIGVDGFSEVVVAVPETVCPECPEPVIEALEIIENGTYTAPSGIDGYSPIVVNVPSSGGMPEDGLIITGNCNYRFCFNGWNWFIDAFGNRITTKNITNLFSCFSDSNELENIPFDLNVSSTISGINTAFFRTKIKVAPNIIGPVRNPPTGNYTGIIDLSEIFKQCSYLRELPEDYFWKIIPNASYWEAAKNYQGDRDTIFYYDHSLRKLPDMSMLATNASYYGSIYYYGFGYCYALDEIINLPVVISTFTSNAFNYAFNHCYRLKDITFETNEDGTPKTANWKGQIIDLYTVGFGGVEDDMTTKYNSGITTDKRVYDEASYQALKDDPDWYCASTEAEYARYNKASAIRTINSLPDTSAYLASSGGTNTIKFRGIVGTKNVGSATDGGAIVDLTEEEIAVATAKGWTVSIT